MTETAPEGFSVELEAAAGATGMESRGVDPELFAQHLAELEGDDVVCDENGNADDDLEVMDADTESLEDF